MKYVYSVLLILIALFTVSDLQGTNFINEEKSILIPTCDIPTSIETLVVSGNVVRVLWDTMPNVDQYKVRFRPVGGSWEEVKTKGVEAFRVLNGLTPNTQYEYGLKSVCGEETSIWSTTYTFTTLATLCDRPLSSSVTNISPESVLVTWSTDPDDTKYKIKYKQKNTDEGWTTIFVNINQATLSGLEPNATYKYKLKSKCPDGWNNWSDSFEFTTILGAECGGSFVDSGGASGNYLNNENLEYLICPDNAGDVVTLSFIVFDTELNDDDMRIYDGTTADALLLGVFNGTNSPEVITSTDVSGCLFIEWSSDSNSGSQGWEAFITCGTPPPCPIPTNLSTTNITDETIDILFESNETGNYVIEYGPAPLTAGTGLIATGSVGVGANTVTLMNLSEETNYEYIISIDCDNGFSSFSLSGDFRTLVAPPECGGTFVDSGGTTGGYLNNENIEYLICPDNISDVVTLTFIQFNTEAGFDDMTIYDGTSSSDSQIGVFDGSNSPGTITSTDASGCLYVVWSSDGSVTRDGWEAVVTCGPPPPCPKATNVSTTNVTNNAVDILFESNETGNYTIEYGPAPLTVGTGLIATGTFVAGVNTASLSDLIADTAYEYQLMFNCDNGFSSTEVVGNFTTLITPPECGGTFVDSGGATGFYQINENEEYLICPDNIGDVVTLAFVQFNTEASFDDMTIYDGTSSSDSQIGVFDGSNSPGTITSTDASGCLYVVWSSDGSVTRDGWEAVVTCGPPPPCPKATNVSTTNVTNNAVDILFESNETGNYTIEYGPAPLTVGTGLIATGTFVAGVNTASLSDLIADTAYEYQLMFNCDNGFSSTEVVGNFTTLITPFGCSYTFVDSGGASGPYLNNEDIIYLICPDVAGEVVSVTFNSFSTENNGTLNCFDGLTIHDGNNISAATINPPNGGTEWCWDLTDAIPSGTGDLNGRTITSTNASGCLTFVWSSDGSVTRDGWEATVSCMPAPPAPAIDQFKPTTTIEALQLFPNPTTELLNINLPKSEWLQIRNIHGQIVYEQSTIEGQIEVVVHDLPSGLYYVNALTTEQEVLTKTFVKK